MSKREPAHFSQNDRIYHFRAKVGRFWVNFGKTITLPDFRRTQISLMGSVLTVFGSKTHHNPKASVSHLSQNDQKYHFTAKIGRFWVNYGKTITSPEVRRTPISFLGSVMTIFGSRTHQSPRASVSQLILLKFCQFWCIFGQKWGPYFIFLDFWINFSVIFHQFGCIPLAQRTQNALRKSKPVFFGHLKKKLHFLDFLWPFF